MATTDTTFVTHLRHVVGRRTELTAQAARDIFRRRDVRSIAGVVFPPMVVGGRLVNLLATDCDMNALRFDGGWLRRLEVESCTFERCDLREARVRKAVVRNRRRGGRS